MNKQALVTAVSNAARALRGGLLWGNHVILTAKDHVMEIYGGSPNLRIWATVETDSEDFSVTVSATQFCSILAGLPGDEVHLSVSTVNNNDIGLVAKNDIAQFVLPVLPKAEYTDIRNEAYDFQIGTKELSSYVSQVVHALDDSGLNPLLGCVYIEFFEGGRYQLTAMDGRRYSMRQSSKKESDNMIADFIVRGHALDEALRLFDQDDTVTIYRPTAGNFIRLKSDNLEVAISTIGGTYFNMSKVRDYSKFKVYLEVNKEKMIQALSLAKIVSNKVNFDVTQDGITLSAKESTGTTEMKVAAKVKHMERSIIEMSFNVNFTLAALQSLKSDVVAFRIKDGISQCVMTDGKNAVEMVLPMKRSS